MRDRRRTAGRVKTAREPQENAARSASAVRLACACLGLDRPARLNVPAPMRGTDFRGLTKYRIYMPHPPVLVIYAAIHHLQLIPARVLFKRACGLLLWTAPPVQSSAKQEPSSGKADNKLVAREKYAMFAKLLNRARQLVTTGLQVLQDRLRSSTKPLPASLWRLPGSSAGRATRTSEAA